MTAAVDVAAIVVSQRIVVVCHHLRVTEGPAVFAIAASIAWHRAQVDACDSAIARSRRPSTPSNHAASVSASRQAEDGGAG
jgi:hypothetical protein